MCDFYVVKFGLVVLSEIFQSNQKKVRVLENMLMEYLTVIEPENETSWNRGFSDFNENRHKDGNLGLHDYEGQQKVIFFNFGKISISG